MYNARESMRKQLFSGFKIFIFIRFSDFSIFHGRYKKLFQLVHSVEVVRRVSLVHYNICLPDIHELVCQRIYTDEIASLANENFHYNHTSFLLTPEVIFCDNLATPAAFDNVIYLNYIYSLINSLYFTIYSLFLSLFKVYVFEISF